MQPPDQPRADACCRRGFFGSLRNSLASIAVASMLHQDGWGRDGQWRPPSGQPHFAPKAKSVIWLFMNGGVSHMESFDPKPMLNRFAGKTIAESPYSGVQSPEKLKLARVVVVNDANGQQRNELFPMQVKFQPGGESGIPVSDFFPHLRNCVDDLSIVRSMYTTDDNHGAQTQFHSGRHMLDGEFPTLGAWVHYGLGSLNENLPQFISMGTREYWNKKDGHYLGPAHDAIPLRIDPANPLDYGRPEIERSSKSQSIGFDLVRQLHQSRQLEIPYDSALQARIQSYELAYRMQSSIPDVLNFAEESADTHRLYGLDHPACKDFGMQMLAARRLVERGVRFIQVQHGGGGAGAWDAHSDLLNNHRNNCLQVDQPIAGLLKDLKRRGLLDETLVVFATEFGRTPGSQSGNGRDHHIYGFSIWMAGGGVRKGIVHGETDEIGFHAEVDRHYVTDAHATILHLLGLDSRQLELPSRKRLEIDHGQPIWDILA